MGVVRTRVMSEEISDSENNNSNNSKYSAKSIETLVVVLAVIAIVGVVAGMVARLCGGRHGDRDFDGWIERHCRSCIDAGIPSQPKEDDNNNKSTKPASDQEPKK